MRRISAILLLIAFVLHFAVMAVYITYFFTNRAQIASEFCINLENPTVDCRGCCHLAKTLNQLQVGEEKQQTPYTPEQENMRFEWFSLGSITTVCMDTENSFEYPFPTIPNLSDSFTLIELPPPRCRTVPKNS